MNSRRDFIKVTALGGSALLLGVGYAQRIAPGGSGRPAVFRPNAWVRIDRNGGVTLTVGRSEMGQGVRTSLPMILADELDADWSRVTIVQASTGPDFKNLNTGGSWSVGGSWKLLRTMGAAAREMLVAAAAAKWAVDPKSLRTENGFVIDSANSRRVPFGELVEAASALEAPKNPPLKSASEFRIIGRRTARIDGPAIVSGAAKYGIDTRVAGMRFATIVRPPVVGGTVKRFDATRAKRVHGVRDVVSISSGVAVVADHTWAAMKGRAVLDVTFDDGPNGDFDSRRFIDSLIDAANRDGLVMRSEGDAASARRTASTTLEATYVYPFYAHAPVETMNCVAHATREACEIWVPTQAPQRVQQFVARKLAIPPEAVTVHVTLVGGGFGRRLAADYAVEAAELSRAIAAPVQVLWTRADDMQNGHLQHASVHALRAGLSADGNVVFWTHKKISNPIMNFADPPTPEEMKDLAAAYRDSAWGAYDIPYVIPNIEASYVRVDSPVRYGPWRSVYAPSSVFARESFIDELAHAARRDPLQFRLDLLRGPDDVKAGDLTINRPRLRRVLETVRDRAGWGRPLSAGSARGVACNAYDGETHVAYVTEVSVDPKGDFRVDRVVSVVDCGPVINPIGVEQQIEGGVIWALAQLHNEITIQRGRVDQSTYRDYPVPRINSVPSIETHIIRNEGPQPFGMGEPPVPPLVPAVLNALFTATGKRIRRLPVGQSWS